MQTQTIVTTLSNRRVALSPRTRCGTAVALMPTSRTPMRLRTPIALRRMSHQELHQLLQVIIHSRQGAYSFSEGLTSPRMSPPQPFATQQGRLVSQGRCLRCSIEGVGADALRAHVNGALPDLLDDVSHHYREDADLLHDYCLRA